MLKKSVFALLALLLPFSSKAGLPGLPDGVVNSQNPQDKPLPPTEALKKITVPEGFQVSLFAAEPDVMQPIAFAFDDRGRMWVVECFSYPDFKVEDKDRILIFTDTDGDGRFDSRKVFLENGHRLSGIAVGFGGVWVCSSPNISFIPDRNGDDVPDGKPEPQLDGWTLKASHNMVNGLAWGPDGWLYGRHGILETAHVGRPGTRDDQRIALNCAIWRYHPTRHVFEVVANGTTNPWGLDWDENGQPFFSNNVIGHLWHLIPGAHYQRMFGEDFNPYLYELIGAVSDHKHFAGGDWTKSRGGQGEHNELGGGHSHCGAMIYQGDNWPDEFRQTIMMANTHGSRLLYDRLERSGSGYIGTHGKSFMFANDPWFRGVMIDYGPDGGVFVSDWNDFGECHDYDGAYRTSGRIYKITYGKTKPAGDFDLSKKTDAELAQLQLHKNEWYVRHARRILQERAAAGALKADTHELLRKLLRDQAQVPRKLRVLWALYVTVGINEQELTRVLNDESEHIRWWAVKLLSDDFVAPDLKRGTQDKLSPQLLTRFARMAKEDKSALVRLGLASLLQRLPHADRWPIAEALAARAEDIDDQNLPLMIWYGLEPAVPSDPDRAVRVISSTRIPRIRDFIARRLAAGWTANATE
jgi:putative membrane-bound dehydrogenase-like protein